MLIITIGRNPDNRIIIDDSSEKVSRNHGEIKITDSGAISYRDISTHGTKVNGKLISNAEVNINRNDQLVFPDNTRLDWSLVPVYPTNLADVKKEMTVGTEATNSIQINGNKISRNHAVLKITKGCNYYIYDQSLNGTYVNGTKIPRYQDYKVNRKDKVFFADAQALNWKAVPGCGVKPVLLYWSIILILLVGLIVWNLEAICNYFFPPDPAKAVCLVYNSFYRACLDGEDTLFIIGDGDSNNWVSYSDYKKDPSMLNLISPFQITGTGFFVSSTGELITNKHVAVPWESWLEIDKKETKKTVALVELLLGRLHLDLEVVGIPFKMGILLNDSSLNKKEPLKNLIECNMLRFSPEKEIDLALIQTKNKVLPKGTGFVKDDEIISDKNDIHVGDAITIIGFPFGISILHDKVQTTSNYGHVSKISDKYEIQYDAASYHGASGSPVFNEKGKLIAINYAGKEISQGFNSGIIATHIIHLMGE